jgi:hypothetical protein
MKNIYSNEKDNQDDIQSNTAKAFSGSVGEV